MLLKFLPLFGLLMFTSCGTPTDASSSQVEEVNTLETDDRKVQDWNPKDNPRPLDSVIQVTSPLPNATVQSPIKIRGKALGYFFFEAVMPVTLTDEDGNVLAEFYARAEDDWMTSGWVTFTSTINYDAPAGTKAWLRLENDDPSDGEGYQRAIIIPVVLE